MEETMIENGMEETMPNSGRKRIRRSPEQLMESLEVQIAELQESLSKLESRKQTAISEFDRKIDNMHARIEKLQNKKNELTNPKARKRRKTKKEKFEELVNQAMKSGLTLKDISQKLGFSDGNANPEPDVEDEAVTEIE